MTEQLVKNYLRDLVNLFYKILPMWENGTSTLPTYIAELLSELESFDAMFRYCDFDPNFMKLILTLKSFLTEPDMDLLIVRRRVFNAIGTTKAIYKRYCGEEMP